MSVANRRLAVALGAALVLTVWANSACADKPPRIPALYDGELVFITVVNSNVVGIDQPIARVADPIYFFGPDGDEQLHVLPTIPGVDGYNPHWHVYTVIVLNGRDLSTDPFLSEDEVLDAEENGEVMVTPTGFLILCQVISK